MKWLRSMIAFSRTCSLIRRREIAISRAGNGAWLLKFPNIDRITIPDQFVQSHRPKMGRLARWYVDNKDRLDRQEADGKSE